MHNPPVNPPVYRVVDDGDSTYIQAVRVHAVHKNGDIVLERPFSGMMGVKFKETALGTVFFSSSKAAVEGFRALQLREIERAERHIDRSKEFLTWADTELARLNREII